MLGCGCIVCVDFKNAPQEIYYYFILRAGWAETEAMLQHLIKELILPSITFCQKKVFGMQASPHIWAINLPSPPALVGIVGTRHFHDELDVDLHTFHVYALGLEEEEEGEEVAVGGPVVARVRIQPFEHTFRGCKQPCCLHALAGKETRVVKSVGGRGEGEKEVRMDSGVRSRMAMSLSFLLSLLLPSQEHTLVDGLSSSHARR